MEFNTTYNKILTDETLMETIQHGRKDYPFHYYYDNLDLFDFRCIEWHWHIEFEFVYVEKGIVTFSIGEDQFQLSPGNGVFVNSKILHRFSSEGEGIIPNFVCKPSFLAPEDSLIYQKYVIPIINHTIPYLVFSPDIPWQKEILQIMLHIISCHDTPSVNELQISSLMQHLWYILCEHTSTEQYPVVPTHSAAAQARLQLMMQYIHTNYAAPVSLENIAASVSISKSSALALFHRYLHLTPIVYLIRYRLKTAAQLLADTEKNISVIAQETGFDNIGYFCRKFKEYYHVTPSEYRKNKIHITD